MKIKKGGKNTPASLPPSSLFSHPRPLSAVQVGLAAVSLVFQVLEDLREKVRVRVQLQHFGAQPVDDPERRLPEHVLVGVDHERLERVGDLVAHVGVGEVEASLKGALQLGRAVDAVRHRVLAQQVHEHHVRRRDEALVLPALEQQSPVDVAEPEDHVPAVQLLQLETPAAHKVPQAAQQLAGGSLDDYPPRRHQRQAAGLLLDGGEPPVPVLDRGLVVLRGHRGHRHRDRHFGLLLLGLVRFPDVLAVELGHLVGGRRRQQVGGHFLRALLGRAGHQLLPGEGHEHGVALQALVVLRGVPRQLGVHDRRLLGGR